MADKRFAVRIGRCLIRALAGELGPTGVTANAISPGSTLFAASTTAPANVGLWNLILQQTSSTYGGTALDLSNLQGEAAVNPDPPQEGHSASGTNAITSAANATRRIPPTSHGIIENNGALVIPARPYLSARSIS